MNNHTAPYRQTTDESLRQVAKYLQAVVHNAEEVAATMPTRNLAIELSKGTTSLTSFD